MPVFALLAHADPQHLERLVDRLAPYPVVVHVDAKSDATPMLGLPRTSFVPDRVDVTWLGFSTVLAQARLLRDALSVAQGDDDHIVLLSGACYPARPLQEFVHFLAASPFRQHCEAALVFDADGRGYASRRLRKQWLYEALPARRRTWLASKGVAVVRRSAALALPRLGPDDFAPLRPVAGSAYIALTAACVRDLLERFVAEPRVALFRRAISPDEMVFHTLLYNSPWIAQTPTGALVPRGTRLTSTFTSLHYVDPYLQGTRTVEDLPAIIASEKFFVRKVSTARSQPLLDALDARVLG